MGTTKTIGELNRELGDQVLDDAHRDPQAYPHRFVGIANGKVVATCDNLGDLIQCLKQAEPDSKKTYFVEIGRDYSKVLEIWRVV
jgi:hypothetical protein